jgi:glycosyltransferase involved in cell wall biosynthesis
MLKVINRLYHLMAALWWMLQGRAGMRKAQRLAQMHRALALPARCAGVYSNRSWQTAETIDVTVIVTCFNYADYVADAVRSVLASACEGFTIELVVIDDVSSDDSPRRLASLLDEASIPMRIIRPWWNVGLSRARNVGLNHARGEFVFILDADNFIESGALRRLCQLARECAADAAYGPLRRVDSAGAELGWLSNRPFDPAFLREQGNFIDAMALFRSTTLRQTGGYDVRLLAVIGGWEDYALWLELAARHAIVAFDPHTVGVYRVKPNSMVNRIHQSEIERAMTYFRARKLR